MYSAEPLKQQLPIIDVLVFVSFSGQPIPRIEYTKEETETWYVLCNLGSVADLIKIIGF